MTRGEGLLIGGSGGAAICAALRAAARHDRPSTLIVVVLPDSGRGYLSKIYSDHWMADNSFLAPAEQGRRQPARRRDSNDPTAPAAD